MDLDVQPWSHIVKGILRKLLKVGEFLEGSAASVDVVIFGQLPGQNFQIWTHHLGQLSFSFQIWTSCYVSPCSGPGSLLRLLR